MFPIKLKMTACKIYIKPAIIYRSEVECLRENAIKNFHEQRNRCRNMCNMVEGQEGGKDFIVMFALHEAIYKLAMVNMHIGIFI